MNIVPFEKAHINAVVNLGKDCFSDCWTESQFLSAMDSERLIGFCLFDGERLIGFISLSKNYDDCDLDLVAVSPEYRRQGFAKLLIEKALDCAKELSLNAVFLEVRESNACAIGLYKKFAFNEIAVRKKYYPDGENAVVMKKEI
jgi:ribosomal-protein-alanine N-acetyltransferase